MYRNILDRRVSDRGWCIAYRMPWYDWRRGVSVYRVLCTMSERAWIEDHVSSSGL